MPTGRNLDPRELLPVVVTDHHCQIQRQIGDVGKRMARVHRQRSQDGKDLAMEILSQRRPFRLRQVGHRTQMNTLAGQQCNQLVTTSERALHQAGNALGYPGECLGWSQAIGSNLPDPRRTLRLQRRDPDHVKLVQVAAENRQELDPFQQRMPRVESLFQNPAVERQP